MTRYIVRWKMMYEDAENEFDAVAQAYGHLCELAQDPSVGANYVQVINPDTPLCHTSIMLDEALLVHELIKEQ